MHDFTVSATAASICSINLKELPSLPGTCGVPGPDLKACGLCLHILEHTWGESHTIWMRAASIWAPEVSWGGTLMAPWRPSALAGCSSSWSSSLAVRSAATAFITCSLTVHSNAYQTRPRLCRMRSNKLGDFGHHGCLPSHAPALAEVHAGTSRHLRCQMRYESDHHKAAAA